MKKILEVKSLNVGYDKRVVVEHVEFEGAKGQMVCLLGPNGAGKSTILRTLSGLLDPVSGTVKVDGKDICRMKKDELARKMAVVLTEQASPLMTTAFEIAAMGRYPHTNFLGKLKPEDKEIVKEALETVGARHLAQRYYSELSDGEKQKVMIARALVQQPEVIILDEPTSHLDIKHKVEIIHILNRLCRTMNLTVVLALHDIDLAIKGCQTLLLVKDGKVISQGAPEDVIKNRTIQELYEIKGARYNEIMGSVELAGNSTKEIFVVGGNGTGAKVYRSLSRLGYGMASGVLHVNDIDAQVARGICSEIITEVPFEKISPFHLKQAEDKLNEARFVVDTGFFVGEGNRANLELLNAAVQAGKKVFSMRTPEEGQKLLGNNSKSVIYCESMSDLTGHLSDKDNLDHNIKFA